MSAETVNVLRPKLKQAQRALEAALDEACETDVAAADSAALLRLEESLTVARDAARSAIDVLRRLHPEEPEDDSSECDTHRVFIDDRGVQWDVFCVYPSRATTGRGRSTLPSPYQDGWLSMQCPHEIRRLAPIPPAWRLLSREALCRLLENAPSAPRRARSKEDRADSSESRAEA